MLADGPKSLATADRLSAPSESRWAAGGRRPSVETASAVMGKCGVPPAVTTEFVAPRRLRVPEACGAGASSPRAGNGPMSGLDALPQAILDALNPARGGAFSADLNEVLSYVRERGIASDDPRVAQTLERLVAEHKIERVETEDGPRYTRAEVLLRAPGLLSLAKRSGSASEGTARRRRPAKPPSRSGSQS